MRSPQAITKASIASARNWSTGSASPASQTPLTSESSGKSREFVSSPVSIRFRKWSTPVSCFRSSESSASSFEPVYELSTKAVSAGYTGKKSRTSLAASLSMDSSYKQQPQNGGDSESNQTALKSPSSVTSPFTFHNPAMPQIRLQIRYEITEVLPLSSYEDLRRYIANNYRSLVRCLEPNLSAKQKEALASCLVHTFEKLPDLSVFQLLVDMLEDELLKNNNPALIFRSNSIGSKAMECYMKLVGSDYLHRLLKPCIDQLLTSDDDFEVDPSRLAPSNESTNSNAVNSQVGRNLDALLKSLDMLWQRIQASEDYLPRDLRVTFNTLGRITEKHCGQETAGRLTSSFLFLRLICPAIHGPVLYGLTTSVPESTRIARNLTLVAKVLQNLANLTLFGEKEQHMKAVNVFVEGQLASMHSFMRRITALNQPCGEAESMDAPDHHRFIDAGYEFARLSRLLAAYEGQLSGELAELNISLQSMNDQTHALNGPLTKDNSVTDTTTLKSASLAVTAKNKEEKEEGKGDDDNRKNYANQSSASNSEVSKQGKWPDPETTKHSSHGQDQRGEFNADEQTTQPAIPLSGFQLISAPFGSSVNSPNSLIHLGSQTRASRVDQSFSGPDQAVDHLQTAEPNVCLPAFNSRGCQTAQEVQSTIVGFRRDVSCRDESDSEAGNLRENRSFGTVLEYSGYTDGGSPYGETKQCNRSSRQHMQQGLKGATSENVLSHPSCTLEESPSLDQLAEKMREIKLILQQKRREAQKTAADRAQAFHSREESLERMIDQVNQLRQATQSSQGHPETVEQRKRPTDGVSPSSSSFSYSGYSEPVPQAELRRSVAGRRHQLSRHATMSEPEYMTVNSVTEGHIQCQSFRTRGAADHQPVGRIVTTTANFRDPMSKHGRLNLLDLSLASEGTGIPLGKLIMSNNTPSANLSACYHRR